MGFEAFLLSLGYEDITHRAKDGLGQSAARKGGASFQSYENRSSEVGSFSDPERTQPMQTFITAS